MSLDPGQARATLRFAAPLAAGRHALTIDYHGKIGRSTLGFFAMDYASPAGARRTLATNFEPASAREFLPCWDEPARKATFTMTVDAPKDRMAISNMPVAEITPLSPAMQRVRFAETPKMSTYLLFLSVGDFERVHRPVDGVDVGVVVKRGDTDKAGYALDQAAALLPYYNGYFGVPYPLPKLDLIAAPGQIAGGSMENWGAIFYFEHHVLFDPRISTEADRQDGIHRGGARDGAPVVRRPGHDGLVGRSVAERGLRLWMQSIVGRPPPSGMGDVAARAATSARPASRRTPSHPSTRSCSEC